MIAGEGFIIATPTKCASHSWEALAKAVPELRWVMPQRHRMAPPEGCEDFDRYFCVRDPYERLVSAWSFICHSTNRSQWRAKEVRGMNLRDWLVWFLKQQAWANERPVQIRAPWHWTMTLRQNLAILGEPAQPIHTEDVDDWMRILADRYGFTLPERRKQEGMYRSNRAEQHRPAYNLSPAIIGLMNAAGAGADAERFGYPVR